LKLRQPQNFEDCSENDFPFVLFAFSAVKKFCPCAGEAFGAASGKILEWATRCSKPRQNFPAMSVTEWGVVNLDVRRPHTHENNFYKSADGYHL
jgi:hypothetical protein